MNNEISAKSAKSMESDPIDSGSAVGEIVSAVNVGLAMPVAIPAMVPYAARSAIVNGLRR